MVAIEASWYEGIGMLRRWLQSSRRNTLHPDSEYTIVSRQVGYGPPASRISDEELMKMNERGRWWCPYCRKFRVFEWDPFWGIDRCPICRVFMNNGHVLRNNPLVVERIS